jgi:hypothetical protein
MMRSIFREDVTIFQAFVIGFSMKINKSPALYLHIVFSNHGYKDLYEKTQVILTYYKIIVIYLKSIRYKIEILRANRKHNEKDSIYI